MSQSKQYSPDFLRFLFHAIHCHDIAGNSFGTSRDIHAALMKTGWFGTYKDWITLKPQGRIEAQQVLEAAGVWDLRQHCVPLSDLPVYARTAYDAFLYDGLPQTPDRLDYLLLGHAQRLGMTSDPAVRAALHNHAASNGQEGFCDELLEQIKARAKAAQADDFAPSP